MSITIDASAIIAVITNEPAKGRIIKTTLEADLIAPESIHWEIGNAFSSLFRKRRITLEQAMSALKLYTTIPIRYVKVELEPALKISNTYGIYAYDAYVVECAIKYRSSILTLDNGLAAIAQKHGIGIKEI